MAFKREIHGLVVKKAGDKTATILVERRVMHPRYRKFVKKFKKYLVHDEKNAVKVKKPSNDAILKQFEETEKLFNKVMNKGK